MERVTAKSRIFRGLLRLDFPLWVHRINSKNQKIIEENQEHRKEISMAVCQGKRY